MNQCTKNPTLIIGVFILLVGLALGSWNSYPKFWSDMFGPEPTEESPSPLASQGASQENDD